MVKGARDAIMGELVLVRHAQASFGSDDYDRLSPLGHRQARWLGEHLAMTYAAEGEGFCRIVRGKLRRHRETTEGILSALPAAPPVIEDPRLDEMAYDAIEAAWCRLTGQPRPTTGRAFREAFPQMLEAWAEGRLQDVPESWEAFRTRVLEALEDHLDPGRRTLVVTSGGPISATLGHLLDLGPHATSEILNMTLNASLHRIEVRDQRLSLMQFNAVPHLELPERMGFRTFI